MFSSIFEKISGWLFVEPSPEPLSDELRQFLERTVAFYRLLSSDDKLRFEQRCVAFVRVTNIVGHDIEVSDHDRLLVAAGSVILAWGFSRWAYVKVNTVILVSGAFNEAGDFGEHDSRITGLVGTHDLAGKMILSQPALHSGFHNHNDKRNVAIHEFSHLIDIADGESDGLPSELSEKAYCLPWLNLVEQKMQAIDRKQSDIRQYGATNRVEFFAVVSEYFFERPRLLKRKHPELYKSLERFYKQNRADIKTEDRVRRKSPCPCGSGKRYKRCCETAG